MSLKNVSPITIALISCLLTALLTGGAWAVLETRDTVRRDDLAQYMQESSPWTHDKGAVLLQLKGVDKLEAALVKLSETLQMVQLEQRVLITKVDKLK